MTHKQNHKQLFRILVFVAMVAVLVACGAPMAPASEPAEGEAAGQPAAEGEPRQGGNLRYTHQQVPASLDANVWTGTNAAHIMRQIYDPLVWQPEPGVFVPGLAERWEINEEGTEFTFWLREDVVFHDGTPLNAEAVKFTYDRMADPASNSLQLSRLGPYDRAEVIDEFTVKVYFSEPWHVFMGNLSEVALAPTSPTAVANAENYALYPVGAGPFKVKEWPDDTTLVLERNPDYNWAPDFLNHQGPAYLDTITYRFIEEKTTRLITLENAEADIIDGPAEEEFQRLSEDPTYEMDTFIVPGMPQILNINVESSPTDELAVRQAMIYAVDRETLVDLIFFGANPPAYGPLSSGSWAYWPGVEEMYPYDPDMANQLLEEAGWIMNEETGIREKDGEPLVIRHVTTTSYQNQRPAEFVQAQLREVGIDDIVEAMAYEATARRYADNDYEMARLGYALFDPHDPFFLGFHSSQIEGGGQFNRSRIRDEHIDELILQGAAETDIEARRAIYQELQEYIMEQALMLPVYEVTFTHVYYPYVKDFKVDLLGREYFYDVWLDQ